MVAYAIDAIAPPPKYADWVSLLAEDNKHFRRSPAAAYWRLAPHYVGQGTETACGLASTTILVNALRGGRAEESMLTQKAVPDAVDDAAWREGVGTDEGNGLSGRMVAEALARLLLRYGVAGAVHHEKVTAADAATAGRLRAALAGAETGDHLITGHYYMAEVLGAGDYGHFSPLGAYDAGSDRVLVLDVYRVTFEPYWVPLERLLAGMAVLGKVESAPRGWIEVRA